MPATRSARIRLRPTPKIYQHRATDGSIRTTSVTDHNEENAEQNFAAHASIFRHTHERKRWRRDDEPTQSDVSRPILIRQHSNRSSQGGRYSDGENIRPAPMEFHSNVLFRKVSKMASKEAASKRWVKQPYAAVLI